MYYEIVVKNSLRRVLEGVSPYNMSADRWDSSPDSRSMPTVDLQWWLSSTDVFYTPQSSKGKSGTTSAWNINLTHIQVLYLVERSQVVPGLDEEGLVDPWVVHIMSCCSHEAQEDVQRAQLLCQLQNTHSQETSCTGSRGLSQCYQGEKHIYCLIWM